MTGKYPNYAIYLTQDKKAMALAAIEPKFWNRFCEVIQRPDLKRWAPLSDTPGFPSPSLEKLSDKQLHLMRQKLQNIFKTRTQKAWIKLFQNQPDCCCTPVVGLRQAVQFQKWLGRGEWIHLKDQKGRTYPQWLFPWGNPHLSRRKHALPPRLHEGS